MQHSANGDRIHGKASTTDLKMTDQYTAINIATPACPNEFHSHEDIELVPALPHTQTPTKWIEEVILYLHM